MKLKNISVATHKHKGYYNILEESCKRNNIDLVVLGLGQKWEGFTMRWKLWYDYLNKLDDNEIIMINDAYDVIIVEDSKEIIKKFKKFKKPVVFGTQYDFVSTLVFKKCLDSVLCCGNIIGYVKYIKIIIRLFFKYEHIWKKFKNDDQIILNEICSRENNLKKIIAADINKNIFFVASNRNRYSNIKYFYDGTILDLKMKNGKLLNQSNNSISVLHLPGNINGNLYLEYLGYDVSNINLEIEKYKVKQVTVFTIDVFKKMFCNFYLNIGLIILILYFIIKKKKIYIKRNI